MGVHVCMHVLCVCERVQAGKLANQLNDIFYLEIKLICCKLPAQVSQSVCMHVLCVCERERESSSRKTSESAE